MTVLSPLERELHRAMVAYRKRTGRCAKVATLMRLAAGATHSHLQRLALTGFARRAPREQAGRTADWEPVEVPFADAVTAAYRMGGKIHWEYD